MDVRRTILCLERRRDWNVVLLLWLLQLLLLLLLRIHLRCVLQNFGIPHSKIKLQPFPLLFQRLDYPQRRLTRQSTVELECDIQYNYAHR